MSRVLSALLMIPLVLGVVWFLPPAGTLALAVVASVLAGFEYVRLAGGLGIHLPRTLTTLTVVAGCVAVGQASIPPEVVVLGAVVLIGVAVIFSSAPGPEVLPRAAAAMFAPAYIGFPLGAIAAIRTMGGREAVLLLMARVDEALA